MEEEGGGGNIAKLDQTLKFSLNIPCSPLCSGYFLTSRFPKCQLLHGKISFCFDNGFQYSSLAVLPRYDDLFPQVKPQKTPCQH